MDINANVIPFIGGEEEKMQQETQKILGDFRGDHIEPLAAKVSAHCNRVPVVDGHTVTISVELSGKPSEKRSAPGLRQFPQRAAGAQPAERAGAARDLHGGGEPAAAAPDAERERGMAAFVGRLRALPGAGLQVHRPRAQHRARRRRRRRAERRADVLGRAARLMIVMKFGGTSVESAAAIERVAAIVKRACGPQSRRRGLGDGQDHQQAARHRRRRHRRQARGLHSRSCTTCAISTPGKRAR